MGPVGEPLGGAIAQELRRHIASHKLLATQRIGAASNEAASNEKESTKVMRGHSHRKATRGALVALAAVMLVGSAAPAVAQAVTIDTAALEGNQIEFAPTLGAAPNGWSVRYKYATSDNTAVKGQDYKEATGTVTFNSGVTTQTVTVDTIDDSAEEDPEIFHLTLYDQEVNGLYRGVTGWVTPTSSIRSMPSEIKLTGQIMDNDSAGSQRVN